MSDAVEMRNKVDCSLFVDKPTSKVLQSKYVQAPVMSGCLDIICCVNMSAQMVNCRDPPSEV